MADSTEEEDHDIYIGQLKEVFDSCDQTSSGSLGREELFVLCHKLQLEDRAEYLISNLLPEEDSEVDFDEFKNSFVSLLCGTVDEESSSEEDGDEEEEEETGDDEEEEEEFEEEEVEKEDVKLPVDGPSADTEQELKDGNDDDAEVSPKFVKGDKKYGRKSAPFTAEELEAMKQDTERDMECLSSSRKSLKHSLDDQARQSVDKDGTESQSKRRRPPESESESEEEEMFEAEGQMNFMTADPQSLTDEEECLRDLWQNLGVGRRGYITLDELAIVCEHVGTEMDEQQLEELFNRLDADGDGRASFQDFKSELFHHNTPTPTPQVSNPPRSVQGTPTNRALSAQKKLKGAGTPTRAEDRTTPSLVQGYGASGLFSVLDPEKTGFAKADTITDLWEKHNIPNGTDVLLALGFDINAKINLSQLSTALEDQMIATDEQNLIFQAAVASYQQELGNTRSALEQMGWAEEKLKLNLAEANARNTRLTVEVDEQHAGMVKTAENKLLAIEKKYQDQVRSLHSELDRERENFSQQTTKQKQTLEAEMENVIQEEVRLREQLLQAQKEMEKVGHDLEETSKQLQESDRQNQRLHRELEATDDLQRKLAEYASTGLFNPEEQRFTQEKMQRLEQENKDLKDHNDELTAELENTKQWTSTSQGKTPVDMTGSDPQENTPVSKIPVRHGSYMSDYIKPPVIRHTSVSSTDSDDESQSSRSGRRLPGTPALADQDISIESRLQGQMEVLRQETNQLQRNFDIERKEMEHASRLEINSIEEKHDAEKEELLQNFQKEKIKLSEDLKHQHQQALAELTKDLQTKFVHEKQDLIEKYESKTNLVEQTFAEDKEKLKQRIKDEYEEDLQVQMSEVKTKFEQEKFQLEEALTELEPELEKLEKKNSDLQKKLKTQREDLETSFEQEKKEMQDLFGRHMKALGDVEQQKNDLDLHYKQQFDEMEVVLRQERQSMDTQMERLQQELKEIHKERAELELRLTQQREELELSFRQEKEEREDLFHKRLHEVTADTQEEQVSMLQGGAEGLKGKTRDDFFRLLDEMKQEALEKDKNNLGEDFKQKTLELQQQFDTKKSELLHMFDKEKEELEQTYMEQIEALRKQLNELQKRLEEEKEELMKTFEVEKEDLEEQIAQEIREELEEEIFQQMEDIKEAFEAEKHEFETQTNLLKQEVEELQSALEMEEKTRRRMEELNKANKQLLQDNRQAERAKNEMHEALESTKKALEARIDELMAEKDGAVTAVKAEFVESSKQSGRDKAVHDGVVLEKEALVSQLARRNQEIEDLQFQVKKSAELEKTVQGLAKEKEEFLQKISSLETNVKQTEVAQRISQEKSELEEKLIELQQKTVGSSDEIHRKYSDLQETLRETQDKLVDTEATLEQAEKELKDALTFRSKCKLLQRKYEDTCSERDRAMNLVSSLKHQLNNASTESKENHEEKGRLAKVLGEKKDLELQLQKVSDKLLEATTNFADCQSQHIQELQKWKEQSQHKVDLNKFTQLQIELVDQQRSLRDMQEAVKIKEDNTIQTFTENLEKHVHDVKNLEYEKDNLSDQLRTLQRLLDGQVDKFKSQFEASEKRNLLVVDLYKENSELMDALFNMEEQKKDAVSRCYKLEDRCRNLKRMLKKVAHVAIT